MNLKSIFTFENLDKALKSIDKNMISISNGINTFGKGMDDMLNELSSDIEKSNRRARSREQKDKANIQKIWGKKD